MTAETTLARPVEIAGVGLHSGAPAHLRLLPAPAGQGIVFRRSDLDGFEVEASSANIAKVSYATSLMRQGVLISTTEHVLSALIGLGVDNAVVELDNLEVPILDGSALPFTTLVAEAGVRRLRRPRRYLRVLRPLELREGGKFIGIYPHDAYRVEYAIDFPHPLIGRQCFGLELTAEAYRCELAPARTFGFLADFPALRSQGLIRGGSVESALVLDESRVVNGPLRFADEFVRHKTLDLIGDLALLGHPLRASVVADRAGHALHTALVQRLLQAPSHWELAADAVEERLPAAVSA